MLELIIILKFLVARIYIIIVYRERNLRIKTNQFKTKQENRYSTIKKRKLA